jgi:hypothetical protein
MTYGRKQPERDVLTASAARTIREGKNDTNNLLHSMLKIIHECAERRCSAVFNSVRRRRDIPRAAN